MWAPRLAGHVGPWLDSQRSSSSKQNGFTMNTTLSPPAPSAPEGCTMAMDALEPNVPADYYDGPTFTGGLRSTPHSVLSAQELPRHLEASLLMASPTNVCSAP